MATNDITTITSDTLKQDPKMAVPAPTQDQTPYESIINGALTSLPTVTSQVDQANKDNESILTKLVASSGDIANKEVFSQNQQELAGVNARKKELDDLDAQFTDLGAQIKGLGRERSAIPLKVQDEATGTGTTTRVAQGQTEAELRKNAIKALSLASEADVLGAQVTNAESRLTRAKENAQLAVDLKYKPIEAEVTRLKDMLELNTKYILNPAEKKLAEKQKVALDERARLLADKKQDEKDNRDLMINANSQGAPASVIANAKAMIAKGAKPADVASVLGVYSGDYIGNQLKLKEMKMKDLEWKIKNNELLTYQGNALAQNADGSIAQGSGATSVDRNVNTVEQIIRRNGKNIPDGAQTQIATALGVVNSVKDFAKQNATGEFAGMYPTAGAVNLLTPDALKRQKTIDNEQMLGSINLKVQQWASGASLTDAQTKLVYDMVPVKGDTDNVVRQKVKGLTDMMNSQISAQLSSAGVKYRAEPSDYFDTSIATRIRNAKGTGYGDTEIVESLINDPVYGAKIQQARQANWTDQQIANYLQTLKEETPQESVEDRTKSIMESRPFGG